MIVFCKHLQLLNTPDTAIFWSVECPQKELEEKACSFLHREEILDLKTFQSEKRRHSYLLGRYCSKQALAHYLKISDLSSIAIRPGFFNQPIVKCEKASAIQISITHTESMAAAIAFPENYLMGIDMETCTLPGPICDTIESCLTESEKKLLYSISDPSVFSWIWTAKEALSKTLKCGLTIPLPLLEIKSLKREGEIWISSFVNFTQFHAFSFSYKKMMFSIALPQQISLKV